MDIFGGNKCIDNRYIYILVKQWYSMEVKLEVKNMIDTTKLPVMIELLKLIEEELSWGPGIIIDYSKFRGE